MTLSIVQILIFVSYITFIVLKFGVLPSISESWYRLRDLGGVWYSLFTWFCWGLGFLMFFQTNNIAPYLFFLSGVGLTAVGTATMFKLSDDIQPYIHFVGALIGILGALIGIGVERSNWIPLLMFILISLVLTFTVEKNRTWWIEMSAFTCIGMGLLLTA